MSAVGWDAGSATPHTTEVPACKEYGGAPGEALQVTETVASPWGKGEVPEGSADGLQHTYGTKGCVPGVEAGGYLQKHKKPPWRMGNHGKQAHEHAKAANSSASSGAPAPQRRAFGIRVLGIPKHLHLNHQASLEAALKRSGEVGSRKLLGFGRAKHHTEVALAEVALELPLFALSTITALSSCARVDIHRGQHSTLSKMENAYEILTGDRLSSVYAQLYVVIKVEIVVHIDYGPILLLVEYSTGMVVKSCSAACISLPPSEYTPSTSDTEELLQ
ncbi:hypothetical protein CYMTET_22476 [Cymbomonas tetramitiformis]|uniref:Uncharacterized protein n=1 Tax=Cymbomonas tetramitiformis TaxID=36881 RepID=A0AAE0L235_9CHLO|nr:hypothetical protein CYMTET_22476 [Cymbomonas tetramitiformis]